MPNLPRKLLRSSQTIPTFRVLRGSEKRLSASSRPVVVSTGHLRPSAHQNPFSQNSSSRRGRQNLSGPLPPSQLALTYPYGQTCSLVAVAPGRERLSAHIVGFCHLFSFWKPGTLQLQWRTGKQTRAHMGCSFYQSHRSALPDCSRYKAPRTALGERHHLQQSPERTARCHYSAAGASTAF